MKHRVRRSDLREFNRQRRQVWTLGLAAVGTLALPGGVWADEAESQQPLSAALSSTTLSGYVDTSAILKFGSGNGTVGRSFDGDAKQNGFNLNVAKVQIEKPIDEGRWAAGYRVGLLFGPDANTVATTSANTLGALAAGENYATSDFAVKNAYVSLRAPAGNGLEFKMGVFDTLIGYEVFEAGSNPNYSRSYGFYIEPLVHTGVLMSYEVCEAVTVSAGIADPNNILVNANTINARTDANGLFSYMGSIAVTAPESAGILKGGTLTGGVIDHAIDGEPDIIQCYVGGSIPAPLPNVTLGIAYDYRANREGQGVDSRWANALAGYIVWQAAEKLKIATRGEYARGSNGTWHSSGIWDLENTDDDGNPDPLLMMDSEKNELLGVTATVDYSLWASVLTRLEFRWDHDLSGTGVFNDGTDKDCLSLALNVIYSF